MAKPAEQWKSRVDRIKREQLSEPDKRFGRGYSKLTIKKPGERKRVYRNSQAFLDRDS